MNSSKLSFDDSLSKSVVSSGKCLGCGTCALTCPFNCLELIDEKPRLVQECNVCSICAQSCPQYSWSNTEVENFVFGRERRTDEEFGVYRKLVIAQSRDEKVLKACQDGGLVTTLLLFAFEHGFIDGAILAGASQDRPLMPIAKLASTSAEILQCAGTKYCYSSNVLTLREVAKQKKTHIAFVGLPCQIRAIRKMQMCGLKKHIDPIRFLIGLACSECFSYEGLMKKHIEGTLNIDLSSVKKMNIKGKMLLTTESEVKTIPLAEAKRFARDSCGCCADFSSEFADISAGGLGLDGWTLTIVRTDVGEKLFSEAVESEVIRIENVGSDSNALSLLRKLSRKKRENSMLVTH